MFTGFHPLQLIIVLVIALLIFGPRKLPEMGSAIGKSIKEFRKGMNEIGAPKDAKEDETKPEKSPEAMREELAALEREIASKKAAAAAQEKVHAEENAD